MENIVQLPFDQQFTFRELPSEIEEVLFKYQEQFPVLRQFLSIQLYLNQFLMEVEKKANELMLPLGVACELTVLEMFKIVNKEDVQKAIEICQSTGQFLPEVLIKMFTKEEEQPATFAVLA